jgi:hypothetical protein
MESMATPCHTPMKDNNADEDDKDDDAAGEGVKENCDPHEEEGESHDQADAV